MTIYQNDNIAVKNQLINIYITKNYNLHKESMTENYNFVGLKS